MRSLAGSLLLLGLAPLAANLYQKGWSLPASPAGVSVPELLGGEVGQGFSQAAPGRTFRFPDDHGPHLDYRTEWWYFTGNLDGSGGQELGYELTLFRQALLSPLQALVPRTSEWASPQAILGHFAVSDLSQGRFYHFQRLSRSALGLAGCQAPSPGKDLAWVEDWHIRTGREGSFQLNAEDGECSIELTLSSLKSPVLQGQQGYSQKADQPGQASHYYSLTRLQTQGRVRTPDGACSARGWSWMDREWSTRPLGSDLVGWDWFALQLSDGQELMFYQLRDQKGKATRWSAGTWVDGQGRQTHLSADQVTLEVTHWWPSPIDGTRYPAGWRLNIASKGVDLTLSPRLANQELTGLGRYWEGAVRFEGKDAEGHRLAGTGYVELVGYADAGLPKSNQIK